MKGQDTQSRAYTVLIASIVVNLSIQVLYVWTLLKDKMKAPAIEDGWGWTSQQAGLPYTFAIIFFALGTLIGGRIQDKIGPRPVASIGGLMVGLGFIISGLIGDNLPGVTVGYGVVTGIGLGFGYGSVLPASMKWFHPSKKGMIGGLVLGGFGLASVHYSFITTSLLNRVSIQNTMLYIGIGIAAVAFTAAQFVRNPGSDYIPAQSEASKKSTTYNKPLIDFEWKEMLKTKRFYMVFILFLFSISIGQMMLGNVVRIANVQAGMTNTVFLISAIAVMNASSRVIGGMVSDKIGRPNTLFIVIIIQMFNMVGFAFYSNPVVVTLGFIITGFCFGTFLAVFPALTADQYGLKNYGVNYGLVYLAYGFAGVVAPVIADYFYDLGGNFYSAYMICAAIMGVMLILNFVLKKELAKV